MIKNKETTFIKVLWEDNPENFTKENKKNIISDISSKYGVDVKNIKVVPRPLDKGRISEKANNFLGEEVLSVEYQRELMKIWMERNEIFLDEEKLYLLDDMVNDKVLLEDNDNRHNSWSINWIEFSNFLSFGKGNKIDYRTLEGLTAVQSNPENFGGKTVLALDLPLYLIYGVTTRTKTYSEIFNKYSTDKDMVVSGSININNKEYRVERKLTRSYSKKKEEYTYKNSLNISRIEGEEIISLNDEESKSTQHLFNSVIGTESDFVLTTIFNGNNLEDLLGTKPTERGNILNRFIGVEKIMDKHKEAKELLSKWNKQRLSNIYDSISLHKEIDSAKEDNDTKSIMLDSIKTSVEKNKIELDRYQKDKEVLLSDIKQVSDYLTGFDISQANTKLKVIVEDGKKNNLKIDEVTEEFNKTTELNFDENYFDKISQLSANVNLFVSRDKDKLEFNNQSIDALVNGEYCNQCGSRLEGVDNSKKINELKYINDMLTKRIEKYVNLLNATKNKIGDLKIINENNAQREKLKFKKVELELNREKLRNKFTELKKEIKEYEENLENIKHNTNTKLKIDTINLDIKDTKNAIEDKNRKMSDFEFSINANNQKILDNTKLIKKIEKQEEDAVIYETYVDMLGKNGITKLVLNSVIPKINAELFRLLDDLTEYDLELEINDKNEVQFYLIEGGETRLVTTGSGFEKTMASLALRCVLSNISSLSKPDFIIFDEILGKVSDNNLVKVKEFFERIKIIYNNIFIISHNSVVKDWSDNVIEINKINNVSKIM